MQQMNVVGATLSNAVNNIVQHCYAYLIAGSSALLHLIAGCSALLHLIAGRNNVAPTTLLHPVFSNLLQLVIFSRVHSKKRTTCSELMKTALNNVVLPTLFNVVNNIVQHC